MFFGGIFWAPIEVECYYFESGCGAGKTIDKIM